MRKFFSFLFPNFPRKYLGHRLHFSQRNRSSYSLAGIRISLGINSESIKIILELKNFKMCEYKCCGRCYCHFQTCNYCKQKCMLHFEFYYERTDTRRCPVCAKIIGPNLGVYKGNKI